MKNILVTGCAGFIGFHISKKLLERNYFVIGIDNLNSYYDVKLKKSRLKSLKVNKKFKFYKGDIKNIKTLIKIFKEKKFSKIIHLAAQPGVNYSFINPKSYIDNNLIGFANILELARKIKCKHLVFASSSSVYGLNKKYPLREVDNVDHPISTYAATKKSNEIMAHVYAYNFNIKITGIRFFTVYGPYGRPDMSILKFINNIYKNKKIDVYKNGNNFRDFTFIDDVTDRLYFLLNYSKSYSKQKKKIYDPHESISNFKIFNIGNSKLIKMTNLIKLIEKNLNLSAKKVFLPKLRGDLQKTFADNRELKKIMKNFKVTSYDEGIKKTIDWYKKYKF